VREIKKPEKQDSLSSVLAVEVQKKKRSVFRNHLVQGYRVLFFCSVSLDRKLALTAETFEMFPLFILRADGNNFKYNINKSISAEVLKICMTNKCATFFTELQKKNRP
jgi:hypothetical protein